MPREGHDEKLTGAVRALLISIHVPREGHDLDVFADEATSGIFQSTCPARGTTDVNADVGHVPHISIHVPREGHDG